MTEISEKNRRLLALLKEWQARPDDKGDGWWDEFRRDLRSNRSEVQYVMVAQTTAERQDGLGTEARTRDLRERNRHIKAVVDHWYETPDELGAQWWDEFEEWLADHRLDLTRRGQ